MKDLIKELRQHTERIQELESALRDLVTSFAEADEEGLIEHAEPMQRARAILGPLK